MAWVGSTLKKNPYLPWLKLILNVTPSVVFGIFTVIFTLQQDSFSRSTRQFEQQQELQQRKQAIFDNCINTISDLLISPYFNRSDIRHLRPVREKVLSALRRIDETQKRDIIFFLYSNDLINTATPLEYRLDLSGADLTNVKFVQSSTMRCDFTRLSLRGVLASNIVFSGCILYNSDFEESVMDRSLFENCLFAFNQFVYANLTQATFYRTPFHNDNLAGASLVRSTFRNVTPMVYVNFTNADLFESSILSTDLLGTLPDSNKNTNTLLNARFPNGSFLFDTSQLVLNSGAEDECNATSNITKHWLPTFDDPTTQMQTYRHVNNSSIYPYPVDGRCYFLAEKNNQISQTIDVSRFSTLIDSDQGSASISAHFGCIVTHPQTEAVVFIGYLDVGSMPLGTAIGIRTRKKPFEFLSKNATIPVGTRTIRLYIAGAIGGLINITIPQYCVFDEIKLSIFDRTTHN